jgi:hypothetical protein
MRSNQNSSGAVNRSAGARNMVSRSVMAKLSMPAMPVEWLDAGSWRLPSGKALAEFALQAGFLAPLLFRADGFGKSGNSRSTDLGSSAETAGIESVAQARGKQLGKGEGR